MGLKIVHTADIHLGHSFEGAGLLPEEGALWRQEIWQVLDQICQCAKEEKADLLLVCGNLMDGELSPADRERCRDLFQEIAPVQVVWILGESDPKEDLGEWPDNVHRVPPGFKRYDFPEKDVVLWAESWSDAVWPDGFSQFIPKASQGQFQILMLHGEADQEVSQYHPIDMQAILQMGIDYCALGHRNHPICWGREGAVWAAYAGSPASVSFEDPGDPGFWIVELEKEGTSCLRHLQRRQTGRRRFVTQEITLRGEQEVETIGDRITASFSSANRRRDFCRVVLTGERGGFLPIDAETLRRLLVPSRFFSLTIVDQTTPELSYDRIREANPDNLLGRYIETMQERIRKAGSERERELLESALAAGVEALLHSQEKGR